MEYQFAPYDVLQVKRTNEWQDFSTLREPHEAESAVALVDHRRKWEGHYLSFRIVRNGTTVYRRQEEI